jgi:hypothetical protein
MRTGDDSIDHRKDVEPRPFRDESGKVEQDRGFRSLIVRFEICARQIGPMKFFAVGSTDSGGIRRVSAMIACTPRSCCSGENT